MEQNGTEEKQIREEAKKKSYEINKIKPIYNSTGGVTSC